MSEITARKYDDMVRNRNYWRDRFRLLRDENNQTESKLSSAEFKISTELKPRIKREERGYDLTGGGANICHQTGQSGNCGEACEWFDTDNCDGDFDG